LGAGVFLALLEVSRGTMHSPWHIAGTLLLEVVGGLGLGVLGAWIASSLMRRVNAYQVDILLTLSLALGGYALAYACHLSAPLEAVAAAIALRRFNLNQPHAQIAHESVDGFWEMLDEVQNAVLFVLLGLEVLAIPFQRLFLQSGLAAIVAVTAVRIAIVALLLSGIRLLRGEHRSSIVSLSWGGLRGGLSIALALSVPAADGRAWILATTYIVVVFSIVIQGGSMDLFLRRLNAAEKSAV
jgi:CPA1 family monovalent cation:H+ antiporter